MQFKDDHLLSNDEFLIIEALEHQASLSIQKISDILDKKKVLPIIKGLLEKKAIYIKEEIIELYKPKLIKYLRLHEKYT